MSFPKIYDLKGTNVGIDVFLFELMLNCLVLLADKVEDFVLLIALVSFMLLL